MHLKGLLKYLGLILPLVSPVATHATVVKISAGPTGWGCTTCYGGPSIFGTGPGNIVTLTNEGEAGPLQLTLNAGTYAIRNAAPTGPYSAWRYDGGDDWAWNFVIGKDLGGNQAEVIDVGSAYGGVHYDSAAAITSAILPTYRFQTVLNPATKVADYYDTLTLKEKTTLDFFVVDGYLPDNVGGVALDISPASVSSVPLPAAAPMFGAALLGLAGLRLRRRFGKSVRA